MMTECGAGADIKSAEAGYEQVVSLFIQDAVNKIIGLFLNSYSIAEYPENTAMVLTSAYCKDHVFWYNDIS